ncbi:hypothetical protein Tco_0339853 [Tanacetum coccineum]
MFKNFYSSGCVVGGELGGRWEVGSGRMDGSRLGGWRIAASRYNVHATNHPTRRSRRRHMIPRRSSRSVPDQSIIRPQPTYLDILFHDGRHDILVVLFASCDGCAFVQHYGISKTSFCCIDVDLLVATVIGREERIPSVCVAALELLTDGNLRELSGEEAWEVIENFIQCQKEWDNPRNFISEQELANLKAQAKRLLGNEEVWVEMHRGIAWDKVENPNPQSTPQVLLSFEENTPPATYPDDVEETIGLTIEVEPLDETTLEDLGLNT